MGEHLAAAPSDPTDQDLHAFGWAPGQYTISCRDCGKRPWGEWADKRASRCRACAEKAFHADRADAATPLGAKRRQVAAQCKAVSHLCRAVAQIHVDYQGIVREGHMDETLDRIGERTAELMGVLGDALNNVDAVESEDAWLDEVFEGALKHGFITDEEEEPADAGDPASEFWAAVGKLEAMHPEFANVTEREHLDRFRSWFVRKIEAAFLHMANVADLPASDPAMPSSGDPVVDRLTGMTPDEMAAELFGCGVVLDLAEATRIVNEAADAAKAPREAA